MILGLTMFAVLMAFAVVMGRRVAVVALKEAQRAESEIGRKRLLFVYFGLLALSVHQLIYGVNLFMEGAVQLPGGAR